MSDDEVWSNQDAVLSASISGWVDWQHLLRLPPWRCVLMARVLERQNLITGDQADAIFQDASRFGGSGKMSLSPDKFVLTTTTNSEAK